NGRVRHRACGERVRGTGLSAGNGRKKKGLKTKFFSPFPVSPLPASLGLAFLPRHITSKGSLERPGRKQRAVVIRLGHSVQFLDHGALGDLRAIANRPAPGKRRG